jgi:hypothetical protein
MATSMACLPASVPASDNNWVRISTQPMGLRLLTFHNPSRICYLNSALQLLWHNTSLRNQILACSDNLITDALIFDARLLPATLLVRTIRTLFEQALVVGSEEIPIFNLQFGAFQDWAFLNPDRLRRLTVTTVGDVTVPFFIILETAQQISNREGMNVTKVKGGTCMSVDCTKKFKNTLVNSEPLQLLSIPITLPSIVLPCMSVHPARTATRSTAESTAPVHLKDLLSSTSLFANEYNPEVKCSYCPCKCGQKRSSNSCNCGSFLKGGLIVYISPTLV